MYTSLDYLSTEEISKIKKRYYQGDSVYRLLGEYNLDIAPSQFYTHLPPDPILDYGCSRCSVNLVVDVAPRSKEKHKTDLSQYYCPICGRKPFAENTDWIAFPLMSEEDVVTKKKLIKRYYESKNKPIAFDSLPLTHKILRFGLAYIQIVFLAFVHGSHYIYKRPIFIVFHIGIQAFLISMIKGNISQIWCDRLNSVGG